MASLISAIAKTPQVLVLLLFLLVPGFVFIRLFDRLHPSVRRGGGHLIIHAGFWSVAIMSLWLLPTIVLLQRGPGLPYWLYQVLFFVLILLGLFGTPILLAYVFHRLELRGTLKPLLSEPEPAPSDWVFSHEVGKHYYVRFQRKEGKDVGGYFGERSFAVSSANGKEIYIEEVWRLDEDGRFIERVEGTGGAILQREDWDFIEFFETAKARDGRTLDGGQTEPSKNETDPTLKP